MKKYLIILSLLFLQSGFVLSQFDIDKVRNNDITKEEVYEHIKYLASDKLEGRYPGTNGDILARQYLSREFQKYGLKPEGDSAYIQRFDMNNGVKAGNSNSLSFTAPGGILNINGKDFTPLSISSTGSAEGKLVFAGYGIIAENLNYNDFKDANGNPVNVEGKVIVIMRYSPTYMNPNNDKFSAFESLRAKLSIIKDYKPAGIILISPPDKNSNDDELMEIGNDMVHQNSGIPVINVKRSVIESMMTERGYDLNKICGDINANFIPNCIELPDITAKFNVDLHEDFAKTGNVIGLLEGSDPVLKNEVLVIGAHFDHLGYGGPNSMYRGNEKLIHHGADDNASGTAGVLELAEKFASERKNIKRSILFLCFTGEEEGLIGSSYFANSEKFKEFNIVAMINMDMIGRLNENKLILNGTGTSTYWVPEIEKLNKNYNFSVSMSPDGFGPSDHSSFYGKNLPVLMFFTDLHADYHKPSDTYDKINSEGETKVLKMVYDMASDISNAPVKPEFTKVVKKEDDNKSERKSVRVYVGTVPDFSYTGDGFKISGVQAGSPAEKYGILAGDIMIKFGDKEIKNIYDYTDALGQHKPGQEVDVTVKRDDKEVTLKVTLGKK
ncbi:MAG: M20/M25/M40 family metallo-hydrolase [Bacteroidetes bacterium]|nr:M20/M25/M40 family metallo-hydrolase [Bacteroidota bacterium]